MSRRRKILFGILIVLALLPSAAVYWLATTESGLRFLLERTGQVGSMTITIEGASGTLTSGLRIGSVRVQHPICDIRGEDVHGRLGLLPLLLNRQIDVSQFTARRVSIALLDDQTDRPTRPPRFLPDKLRIDADAVRVDELDITLKSGRTLKFLAISGATTILQKEIRVRGAQVDWEDWRLAADGRLRAARPMGLDGEATALWTPQGKPQWRFSGSFDGDLQDLPLKLAISEPFLADVEGKAVLQSDWLLAGHAVVSDFDLDEFGGGDALGIMAGELDVTASREGLTARGRVTPPGLEAGAFDVDFRGAWEDKVLTVGNTVIVHPGSGTRATVRGTMGFEEDGLRLALSGGWTQLRWPLAAPEPAFTSPRGSFGLDGVKPWQLSARGDVVIPDLPAMPAQVRGQLSGESFVIEEGTLSVLGGNASITAGEARWNPAQSWHVQGRMAGLDPRHLRDDLPGELDFDFTAGGGPFGAEGSIDFAVDQLRGELRDQPVRGKGLFARRGGSPDWRFSDVDITLGTAHVQLDGGLGAAPDLDFRIEAEDLSLIHPDARGAINARGRFAGTRGAPVLRAIARGTGFEWRGYQLAALDADIDIDLSAQPGKAEGTLVMEDATIGARTIKSASLALTGSGERQRLALAVDAAPLSLRMGSEGNLREGLWRGDLTSLTIDQPDLLTLRNESPAPISFNLRQFELGQLCLKGDPERLCASGQRAADGRWTTSFSADALPLSTFTAGLSQEMGYEGTIDLRGELAGAVGALPTGRVDGQLMQAQLRHKLSGGREEIMSLGTGRITAEATASDFSVLVGLDADEAGSIQGRLDGERNAGDWRDYPIRGSLDAHTDALALIDHYVGEIDRASGRLITRVDFGGTLGTPQIKGELQLRDASIDIFQINLALRQLSLDASFDANTVQLRGESTLGEGTAHFNGRLAWRDGRPFGNLHMEGERLQLVNVPEARILASPNLDFRIDGRRIDATGEVRVPYARLEPARLTGAVLVSGDQVLVGEEVVDPSQRWVVVSRINMVFGNDVSIEALGLAARLGGSLEVRADSAQDESRGVGELVVTSGKYEAYGRLLDIKRGRLIFNNVPLNDPAIDVSAEKEFPDATAGVNVRGTLRAPRLSFYSEPSLPQSQIASLILAGGSIESLSESQAPGAARNDLLAQGGAMLFQRVGPQVGVDEVGIESDINNESSLVLGKYLSPRLYISYGISLAEAINTLKLRYRISERWTIKTEAGEEQSADLEYTLRK